MFDNHIHSVFSFDVEQKEENSVRNLCKTAMEKGLSGIAITDHFDIDAIHDGFFPPLDHEGIKNAVNSAKEEFSGKFNLLHGIEFGQATHMPEEAKIQIKSQNYDVVLASCHGVRGIVDYADTDLGSLDRNQQITLWERYLEEMLDTVRWGDFEVLTHLTYPKRYYLRNGISDYPDISGKGREYFEPILKAVIEHGKTLECNTSGLRQLMKECLPNRDLFSFYYELGGRDVCLGSDSHGAQHIAAGFETAKEMLKSVGFTHLTCFKSRNKFYETL